MSKRFLSFTSKISQIDVDHPGLNKLIFYATIIFLVRFSDALMAYFTPVYLETNLNSAFLMGLIISTSSMVGLACDFLFGELFDHQRYYFFLFWGIIAAIAFPLSFLFLPPVVTVFLISMAIWGIYYELILFSNFHFINHSLSHNQHAMGWGILYGFIAAAYMIAPIIASMLLSIKTSLVLIVAAASGGLSLLSFFLYRKKKRLKAPHHEPTPNRFRLQIKLWRLLAGKLWPVLTFVFILYVLDSAFWTSGAVLSETLRTRGLTGGILFVVYLLPSLFMSLFIAPLSRPFGKKKAAFVAGMLAGLLFAIAGQISSPFLFIGVVFIASTFIAIALPEINGAIEDYIERLGPASNNMVGLENSMTSLSYIVGPILAGAVAAIAGHQATFSVVGILLLITSIISYVASPRKIRLPQSDIKKLLNSE